MNIFKDVNRIIFDLDNTLIKHDFESENLIISKELGFENSIEFKRQYSDMFKKHSSYINWKPITEEYFASVIENLMPILKINGKSGKDVLKALYDIKPGKLMDGAKELLEYLYSKDYEIVALTNWFYKHQLMILHHLGISNYFEKMYAWDDYYAKPNRLAMMRALASTDPINNVIIGDDPIGDITTAKKCGIKTIGFNINHDDFKKCSKIKEADVYITSLSEVKNYL